MKIKVYRATIDELLELLIIENSRFIGGGEGGTEITESVEFANLTLLLTFGRTFCRSLLMALLEVI